MSNAALEAAIEAAWEIRDQITPATKGEARDAVEATLEALDKGALRVAEKRGADWHVNQWAKKAVLLAVAERVAALVVVFHRNLWLAAVHCTTVAPGL